MINLSELQTKEVVLLSTGRRLGFIDDLEIDNTTGKIITIIVIERNGKSGFFTKPSELAISWEQITTIGTDIILIKDEKSLQVLNNDEAKHNVL